jgi:methionyl-tRNA formyltransferase
MRLLFIGTGEIGLPAMKMLLDSPGRQLIGVVTQPDKPAGRRQELQPSPIKQLALEHNVPLLQPARIRDPQAIEKIASLKPDVIVVMAYGQILPGEILRAPALGCLNLHASLLPRHRGAAPISAAIAAGDHETGITVMFMDEGLDTGDIMLMKKLPIRRRETAGSLHERLAQLAPGALSEALALLEQGRAPRESQDAELVTYAPKLSREDGRIGWNTRAIEIERKIRALNPWPGAHTFITMRGGIPQSLKIFSTILCRKKSGIPGHVLCADHNGILVAAGEGALLLREIQLEGKRRMSAREFVMGHSIAPGAVFS